MITANVADRVESTSLGRCKSPCTDFSDAPTHEFLSCSTYNSELPGTAHHIQIFQSIDINGHTWLQDNRIAVTDTCSAAISLSGVHRS